MGNKELILQLFKEFIEFKDFKEEINKTKKMIFVPIIPQSDKWTYVPGTYFKHQGREVAVLQTSENQGIPCDPRTGTCYEPNPISLTECSEYVYMILMKLTREEYLETTMENERLFEKSKKKCGPQPPIRFFEVDDPEATKFLDKIVKEQSDDFMD